MATIDTPMKARLNGTDHGTRVSTITVLGLSWVHCTGDD
jgi:hypothetical protein